MTDEQFKKLTQLIKSSNDDLRTELKQVSKESSDGLKVELTKQMKASYDGLVFLIEKSRTDVLGEVYALHSGYAKEIDYLMQRVRVLEEHLKIESPQYVDVL